MKKLDFIGIGVTRSGTTWTWQQLKKHPQTCLLQTRKEAQILIKNTAEIIKKFFGSCDNNQFIGEYTPTYLQKPEIIIPKIKRYFPDAKLLLMLRNPLDRIFTQYKALQWKKFGKPKQRFKDWFDNNSLRGTVDYVGSNNYMDYLPYWSDLSHNLKINFYEDIINDPLEYIQDIYDFVGLNRDFVPPKYWIRESKPYNDYYDANPIEMSKADRSHVKKYYYKSIAKLEKYLKKDTGWLD